MTKYEDLIKQRKNKNTSVDEIAKKYKMSVMDVKTMQEWKEKYEKEHKLRQEAETETILVKGIGINSPEMKAAKQKIEELQKELDRFKKENNECYNRIADLTESLKSKDYFKDPDYKFLVEENLDLRRRITEIEQEVLETKADNIKLSRQIEDKMDQLRRSGAI